MRSALGKVGREIVLFRTTRRRLEARAAWAWMTITNNHRSLSDRVRVVANTVTVTQSGTYRTCVASVTLGSAGASYR